MRGFTALPFFTFFYYFVPFLPGVIATLRTNGLHLSAAPNR